MRWLIKIGFAVLFGAAAASCDRLTGPDETPRILTVDARACPRPQLNFEQCVRNSESFDPAVGLPRDDYVWVVTTYQYPPDPAWEVYSLVLDGFVVANISKRIRNPVDLSTGLIVGDTVGLGVFSPTARTFSLEINLAEGTDQRFISPVADTAFVWRQLERPPDPE